MSLQYCVQCDVWVSHWSSPGTSVSCFLRYMNFSSLLLNSCSNTNHGPGCNQYGVLKISFIPWIKTFEILGVEWVVVSSKPLSHQNLCYTRFPNVLGELPPHLLVKYNGQDLPKSHQFNIMGTSELLFLPFHTNILELTRTQHSLICYKP